MEKQLPLSAWLPISVIVVLTGSGEKKQNGLGLVSGAGKLRAVTNSCPKGDEFMLKGGCVLAIGKGKMVRCVLVLKCQQTE